MVMTTSKRLAYLFTGVLILALAACSPQLIQVPDTGNGPTQGANPTTQSPQPTEMSTQPPSPSETSSSQADLTNTYWTLISFGEAGTITPTVAGTDITVDFAGGGQVTGSGGCNSYGAQYQVQDGSLSFSQIISTQMACTAEGVMDQEQHYFKALQSASSFKVTGDQLVIHYGGGAGTLNFTQTSPPAATGTPASELLCAVAGPASRADWNLCRSLYYGFEVQYPAAGQLVDQSATSARINLPFTSGTNLTEKYLEIDAQENTTPCSSPLAAGYTAGTIPREPVQINGLEFIKESGQGAAAGNIYTWEAYSISRDNLCLSLGFVLHSFQPELQPTPPPRYEQASESQIFTEIVGTFAWLTSAGTATPPVAQPTLTIQPTPTAQPTPAVQPTLAAQRIDFGVGRTSATLNGHLPASGSALYVLRALQGQNMTVDLSFSQGQAILVVWGADGDVLMSDHAEAAHFQGTLPSTQDYYIQLKGRPDGPTDYQLKVTIPPLATQSTLEAQRIKFGTGKTSATVSGHLAASGSDLYVLSALQGQNMTVGLSFSQGQAILVVWGADGNVLMSDHAEAAHFQGTLPSAQDYYIQLKGRPDGPTDYQLKVTIPPK